MSLSANRYRQLPVRLTPRYLNNHSPKLSAGSNPTQSEVASVKLFKYRSKINAISDRLVKKLTLDEAS
jgi:hypothetical protein